MKFLILLIIVIVAAVLLFSFSENIRSIVGELRNELPGVSQPNPAAPPTVKNQNSTSTPPGFRGPTGKPGDGFIGPRNDPPNY